MMEYDNIYKRLKKDELWNSPYNLKLLDQFPRSIYICPSVPRFESDPTTNYMAVIGPGTAWRKDGPVKRSDLPDRGSHTVMAVEVVDSGVHWAEPRDLTVEEALEGLKTGKGLRISTAHPGVINVLFADGSVRCLPAKMPYSTWEKLLAGEVRDFENLGQFDESAPDMVDVTVLQPEPGKWKFILSAVVWLFSVALLFRRAIKSRQKPAAVEMVSAG